MRLTIKTNFPQVQRALDQLQDEVAAKATARAVNATIAQAKTEMGRQIRNEYVVDLRFVRERLRIKRATFFKEALAIEAALFATEKPRSANLIRFAVKRTSKAGAVKLRGFRIKRGSSVKTLTGAFIGNKGRTVFERVPGSVMKSRSKSKGKLHREAIKPVQTIDVPQMFNAKRVNAAVVAAMQAKFPAIFERELAYALATFNRGR